MLCKEFGHIPTKWVESELEQSKQATSVARIGRKNSFRSYVECCLLCRQTPTAKLHSIPNMNATSG